MNPAVVTVGGDLLKIEHNSSGIKRKLGKKQRIQLHHELKATLFPMDVPSRFKRPDGYMVTNAYPSRIRN